VSPFSPETSHNLFLGGLLKLHLRKSTYVAEGQLTQMSFSLPLWKPEGFRYILIIETLMGGN
jgi:hypothetical protein